MTVGVPGDTNQGLNGDGLCAGTDLAANIGQVVSAGDDVIVRGISQYAVAGRERSGSIGGQAIIRKKRSHRGIRRGHLAKSLDDYGGRTTDGRAATLRVNDAAEKG